MAIEIVEVIAKSPIEVIEASQGVKGDTGISISNAVLNDNGHLIVTFDNDQVKDTGLTAFVDAVKYRDEAKAYSETAKEQADISSQKAVDSANSATAAKLSETNSGTSEINAKSSENASLASANSAGESKTLAQQWATKTDDTVDGNEYSSKYYANQSRIDSNSASNSATSAEESAQNASAYATNASAQATASEASAVASKESETASKISETNAKTSETNANLSSNSASASATAASDSQIAAKDSETNAKNSETNANVSKTAAENSASSASSSATTASSQALVATTQAGIATTGATTATDQANLSKSWATKIDATVDGTEYSSKYYATQSSTSASNAASSQTAAKTSEDNSKISETNAKTSETNANLSSTSADNSASTATTQAINAANSASSAAQSATSSANSATSSQGYMNEAKDYAESMGTALVTLTGNNSGLSFSSINGSTGTVTLEDMGLGGVYEYKGSVATYADLPTTGVKAGWVYNVVDTGKNYAYTPEGTWDDLGGAVDLSSYSLKKDTVKSVLGQNNILDITNGEGVVTHVTIDNVPNATHASSADTSTTATTADLASKATQDGSGNNIDSTYLKLSGGNIKGDIRLLNSTSLQGYDNSGSIVNLARVSASNETELADFGLHTSIYSSTAPTWETDTDSHVFAMTSDIPTSTVVAITLSSASWSNGTYTYANSSITANSKVTIVPNATNTTSDMYDAVGAGKFAGTVTAGQVVIKALGTVPTIDISCDLLIEG